jgi:hypothetical protein
MRKFLSDILVKASLGVEQNAYVLGTVGIGTASPTSKLQIGESYLATSGTVKLITINTGGYYSISSGSQYNVMGFSPTTIDTSDIYTQTAGESVKNFYLGVVSEAAYFNSNRFSVFQGGVERLTIQGYGASVGNVGIGTTSPGYKLEVGGTLGVNGNATFNGGNVYINSDYSYIGNNTTDLVSLSGGTMYLPGNGNVGIGTTSPNALVSISKTISSNTRFLEINNAGNNQYSSDIDFTVTSGGVTVGRISSIYPGSNNVGLSFSTYGTSPSTGLHERMRINGSDGNVGIGTTSPSYKLHVEGTIYSPVYTSGNITINAGDFLFSADGGGDGFQMDYYNGQMYLGNNAGTSWHMVMQDNGNIGIGTTSPGYLLDVNGTARFGSATYKVLSVSDAGGAGWGTVGGVSTAPQLYMYNTGTNAIVQTYINNTARLEVTNTGISVTGAATFSSSVSATTVGAGSGTNQAYLGAGFLGFYNAASSPKYIQLTDDASTINAIAFSKSGSSSTTSFPSGNVGINTSTPASKLHVEGNISAGVEYNGGFYANANSSTVDVNWGFDFSKSPSISDYSTRVKFYSSTGSSIKLGFWDSRTSSYVGYFDGGLAVPNFIIPNGNVGIGTTSPVSSLSVVGKTNLGGQASGFYVTPSTLHIASSTVSQISFEDYIVTAAIALANNTFAFGHQNASPSYEFKHSNTYNGNYATTGTTFARFNPTTSYISSGNVGIGTTSPGAKLDVVGKIAGGSSSETTNAFSGVNNSLSQATIYSYNYNASGWSIYSAQGINYFAGNVGIGTTSPAAKLDVFGAIQARPLANGSSGNYWYMIGSITDVSNFGVANGIVVESSGLNSYAMTFGTQTTYLTGITEKMRITSSGNVGIGTSDPSVGGTVGSKFTIIQSDNSTAIAIYSGTSRRFAINPISNGGFTLFDGGSATFNSGITQLNGNVGIGTTSPATKLTLGGYSGSRLPYIDGTGSTFNANGITVTSANSANSAIGGGLDLTNNTYSIGAYSPIISFSSISSNGSFNAAYAGIWGIVSSQGVDANWIAGHLAFGSGAGAGISERMRITSAGNVGIGTTSPNAKLDVNGTGMFASHVSATLLASNNGDGFRVFASTATAGGSQPGIGYYTVGGSKRFTNQLDVSSDTWGVVGTTGTNYLLISQTGAATFSNLAGTGTRMVVADANGLLSTQAIGSGAITGSGTTNYLPKFTGTSTIGNSQLFDNGSNVGVGTDAPSALLTVSSVGFDDTYFRVEQRRGGYASAINLVGATDAGAIYNRISSQTNGGTTHWQIGGGAVANTMAFYTGGNLRATLNASGNLGLGVTPSAWFSTWRAIEIGGADSNVAGNGTGPFRLLRNAYIDAGGTWIYKNTGEASFYQQSTGNHIWYSAPSGTAGNSISFTPLMTLNASGNLSVGNTNDTYKLDVSGTVRVNGSNPAYRTDNTTSYTSLVSYLSGTRSWQLDNVSNDFWLYMAGSLNTYVLKIAASTGAATFSSSVTATNMVLNNTTNDAADTLRIYRGTSGGYQYQSAIIDAVSGDTNLRNIATDSARAIVFSFSTNGASSYTERMRITSGGNVGIGVTNPDQPLAFTDSLGTKIQLNGINGNGYQVGLASAVAGGDAMFKFTAGEIGAGEFGFYNTTNLRMLINASGNVGIGTGSPSQKLDVAGNIISTEGGIASYRTSSEAQVIVNLSGNQMYMFNNSASYGLYSTDYGSLFIRTKSTGLLNIYDKIYATSGGNVGIGTTSPGYKLEVGGTLGVNGNATFNGGNVYINSDYSYIGNNTTDLVSLSGGTMYLPGNGNVGIGTTSPSARLDVETASGGYAAVIKNTTAGGDYLKMIGDSGNTVFEFGSGGTGGEGFINIYSDAVQKVLIDANGNSYFNGGNVGIGTTSPSAKLDVNGAQIIQSAAGFGTDGDQAALFLSNTANFGLSGNFSGYSRNLIKSDGGSILTVGRWNTSLIGELSIESGSSGLIKFLAGASERMRITSGGQFWFKGVSTSTGYEGAITNTETTFDIYGSRYGGTGKALTLWATGASESMRINYTNNILIGTTVDSGYKLDVNGTGRFTSSVTAAGGVYAGDSKFFNSVQLTDSLGGTCQGFLWTDAANTLKIGTGTVAGGNVKMTILSAGNVGIGTTSPLFNLQVGANAGTFATTTIRLQNSYLNTNGYYGFNIDAVDNGVDGHDLRFLGRTSPTGAFSELVRIKNSGNVGIGTSTPNAPLQVVGTGVGGIGTLNLRGSSVHMGLTSSANVFKGWYGYFNTATHGSEVDLNIKTGYAGTSNIRFSADGDTTPAMLYIASGGNVGIGTTSPSAKLHVVGSTSGDEVFIGSIGTDQIAGGRTGGSFGIATKSGSNGNLILTAGGTLYFRTGGSNDRVVITSSGNVGIGTTSPSYNLHVEGNVSGISIYASHDIAAFSDITVKKEVKKIKNAIEKVKELNGYTYVRTDDETGTRRAGVIAQEVQKVLPEVVSANPDGTLNVAYSNMIALLIEGMKEQQATIERLENRIKILEK